MSSGFGNSSQFVITSIAFKLVFSVIRTIVKLIAFYCGNIPTVIVFILVSLMVYISPRSNYYYITDLPTNYIYNNWTFITEHLGGASDFVATFLGASVVTVSVLNPVFWILTMIPPLMAQFLPQEIIDQSISLVNFTGLSNHFFFIMVAAHISVFTRLIYSASKSNSKSWLSFLKKTKGFTTNERVKKLERRIAGIYRLYEENPSKAGYAYETAMRDLFIIMGYECHLATDMKKAGNYPPALLKSRGDGGIDLILVSCSQILLVQIKLKLGKSMVKGEDVAKTYLAKKMFEEYYRSIGISKDIIGVVLTPGQLDGTAWAYAEQNDIWVWSNPQIEEFINEAREEQEFIVKKVTSTVNVKLGTKDYRGDDKFSGLKEEDIESKKEAKRQETLARLRKEAA